jgi:hypothetical protein
MKKTRKFDIFYLCRLRIGIRGKIGNSEHGISPPRLAANVQGKSFAIFDRITG